MRLILPLATLLLALAPASHAAWSPTPGGVPVTAAFSDQHLPQVLADGAGGMFVVWADLRTGDFDIRAQRLAPTGQLLWNSEGVVVCSAPGQQDRPQIVTDGAGGAIVVWEDSRTGSPDLRAQRLSPGGATLWAAGGVVVTGAADEQSEATAIADGAGGVIVAWTDLRSGVDADVYAQRLSPTGAALWTANGVALCTAAGDQFDAIACSDGAGGAIVAWNDLRVPAHQDVFARRISASGTPQWTANGVRLCDTTTGQSGPAAISDGAGGALVAWTDGRNGAGDIAAQRVDAVGARLWGATGVLACAAPGVQSEVVAHAAAGGAVLAWQDARGASVDVYAQRLDLAGTSQWSAAGVPVCAAPGPQDQPAIHADGAGGTLLTWQDRRGATLDIAAQRLDTNGQPVWMLDGILVCTATGSQSFPAVAPDGSGGALLAWEDGRAFQTDVYGHRVHASGALGGPEPRIVAMADVPEDDGGQISVTFAASLFEQPALGVTLTGYRVERLDAGGPVVVEDVPAAGLTEYTLVVPTLRDSSVSSPNRTHVRIAAYGPGGTWTSAPDSLASRDEIAPPQVATLYGVWDPAASRASLRWLRPSADAVSFRIHRGTWEFFVPTPDNLVATTTDTTWTEIHPQARWYRVVSVDDAGNVGTAQYVLVSETVSVVASADRLTFARPSPEPSRAALTLAFALPSAGPVRLELFDEQGRRVRTLQDGLLAAGPHVLHWDGRDDQGRAAAPGVLFARLRAAGEVRTQRITRLR